MAAPGSVRAQDNYEIQVYGPDLVEKGHTMVEWHSNFTFQGSRARKDSYDITKKIAEGFDTGSISSR